MNFVDIAALLGMGMGFLRGRKRGLDLELFKLINMGIVFLAGCSLFKLVGKLLSFLPGLNPDNSGFIGFITVIVASIVVLRKIRGALRAWLKARFGTSQNKNIAGWVGLARWGTGIIAVLAGMVLSRADVLTSPVTEGSLIGKTLALLLGS